VIATDTLSGLDPHRVAPVARTGALSPVVIIYLLMVAIPIGVSLGPLLMTGVRLVLMVMIVPLIEQPLTGD